jgi:hypothetical protein
MHVWLMKWQEYMSFNVFIQFIQHTNDAFGHDWCPILDGFEFRIELMTSLRDNNLFHLKGVH